ncbi:cytochrome c3 family protein [Dethiobacter alkaliphilus]|uniref:cytochrome c3 family protein n=1 Tax=Dethiobacter alkaliphilus TaxID=427926 RepID=UPI0022265C2A|nr:cytochrome c3 family protein [Dethiobacter alkaliphilus]MCW3491153.1 hypothetical protein [Dethiobacter alkaliphilus]
MKGSKKLALVITFVMLSFLTLSFYLHTTWAFIPPEVEAMAVSGTQIQLDWNTVNGAVGYQVFRSTDNENFARIRTVRTEGLIDGGLDFGVQYFYKVNAFDDGGNLSDYSSIVYATISPELFEEFRSPHGPYSIDSDGCAACHSTHAAISDNLLPDEGVTQLCYSCHDGARSNIIVPDHKVSYGAICIDCHTDSMVAEKERHYNNDCYGCHSSGDKTIFAATRLQKDSCFSCHSQPHDVYMASLRGDIPLYPNVQWSRPQNAEVWSGEAWLPSDVNDSNAEIIFSTRTELNPQDVLEYYSTNMSVAGWRLLESTYEETNFHFELKYSKGNRYALIWYFSGDDPNSEGSNPEGARLKMAYH